MARRYRSLHFNLQDGENVVYHREHISPRNRHPRKVEKLAKFKRQSRRWWKSQLRNGKYLEGLVEGKRKKKRY